MKNKGQEFDWQQLKDVWASSAQTKEIHIQMSDLLEELKGKVSQFEKTSIQSDIAALKTNWIHTRRKVSQFEKDLVSKDLAMITRLLRRFLNLFKSDR
jgi:hypothetical protein